MDTSKISLSDIEQTLRPHLCELSFKPLIGYLETADVKVAGKYRALKIYPARILAPLSVSLDTRASIVYSSYHMFDGEVKVRKLFFLEVEMQDRWLLFDAHFLPTIENTELDFTIAAGTVDWVNSLRSSWVTVDKDEMVHDVWRNIVAWIDRTMKKRRQMQNRLVRLRHQCVKRRDEIGEYISSY